MKRFLALTIALCMIFPIMIACKKEKEYLVIGTMDREYGNLTVVVSPDGNDETADGTAELPYATIQAAVDDIAKIDHATVSGITVLVKSGTYSVTSPITVDPAPDQERTAMILFLGEGDVTVTGGVTLASSDFAPATGDTAKYFPEADKVVQLDLKNYGFTAEQIAALIGGGSYYSTVPAFYANNELETLARYPNDSFISVTSIYDAPDIDISTVKLAEGQTVPKSVFFSDEHLEHINSWHDKTGAFVAGHLSTLDHMNDSKVAVYFDSIPKIVLEHTPAEPKEGGVFYFYNIPEELDAPGEYYIDENAVLYYYPTEDFENTTFTLPVSNGIFSINTDARVENMKLTASLGNGITATDCVDIWDCEISEIGGQWAVSVDGGYTDIKGNYIHNCRANGVYVDAGNIETLEYSAVSYVNNNLICNYGNAVYPASTAISANGVQVTVSHNEIRDSASQAITFNGAYHVIEYNNINNVLTGGDTLGAVSTTGMLQTSNTIRYNYIGNVGVVGAMAELEGFTYYGSSGIQGYNNGSYYEAYGNVISVVNGNGIVVDGRGVTARNNLLIGCANWYILNTAHEYSRYFKNGESDGIYPFEDYIFSPVWKEANPDLASVIFDLNQTTKDDPRAWSVPLNNVIDSNWVHYDRFVRYFDNWGTAPYSVEDTVYRFSPDTIDVNNGARDNGNHSIYNSRRNEINLEELITTTAADFVDIDWETFQTVGRVMDEWKLGE